jgi:hypothetical protein
LRRLEGNIYHKNKATIFDFIHHLFYSADRHQNKGNNKITELQTILQNPHPYAHHSDTLDKEFLCFCVLVFIKNIPDILLTWRYVFQNLFKQCREKIPDIICLANAYTYYRIISDHNFEWFLLNLSIINCTCSESSFSNLYYVIKVYSIIKWPSQWKFYYICEIPEVT